MSLVNTYIIFVVFFKKWSWSPCIINNEEINVQKWYNFYFISQKYELTSVKTKLAKLDSWDDVEDIVVSVSANEIFADNIHKKLLFFNMSSKTVGLFLFIWFRLVTSNLEQGKLFNNWAIKFISNA